jgi:hypothetical protein
MAPVREDSFVAKGPSPTAFATDFDRRRLTPLFTVGLRAIARRFGVMARVGDPPAPRANELTAPAAVLGTSGEFTGVAGASIDGSGVVGVSGDPVTQPPMPLAAVCGSSHQRDGVVGISNLGGGLVGLSRESKGVRGERQPEANKNERDKDKRTHPPQHVSTSSTMEGPPTACRDPMPTQAALTSGTCSER